ncbi:MAG: hypothetical protein K6D97_03380 [Clostridia bacterium]|nr:hypothetical protein [Clostridia bacterium]
MIKNIIFDLSEVIISGYYGTEKIIASNTDADSLEEELRKRNINIVEKNLFRYFHLYS